MNRRKFLSAAGGSVAAAGLNGLTPPYLRGQQQQPALSSGPPPFKPPTYIPTIWDNSAAAFAAVVPQGTYVTPNGAGWVTLSNALQALYTNLLAYPAFDQSL